MTIEDGIKLLNQIGMEVLGYTSHKRIAKKYKIAKCPKCDHHIKVVNSLSWQRLARAWCPRCDDGTTFVKDRISFATTDYYRCSCLNCKKAGFTNQVVRGMRYD